MTALAPPVEAARHPLKLSSTALTDAAPPPPAAPKIDMADLEHCMTDASEGLDTLEKIVRFSATVAAYRAEEDSPAEGGGEKAVAAGRPDSTAITADTESAIGILTEPNSIHDAALLKRSYNNEPVQFVRKWDDDQDPEQEAPSKRPRESGSSPKKGTDDLLKSPRGRRADRGIELLDSFEL